MVRILIFYYTTALEPGETEPSVEKAQCPITNSTHKSFVVGSGLNFISMLKIFANMASSYVLE